MSQSPETISPVQSELGGIVRRFCRQRFSSEQVRTLMDQDPPVDRASLAEMGALGWLGLALPEAVGGQGAGLVEQGVVLEQLGMSLAAPQVLTSAVGAAQAILAAGDEAQQAALLPGLASGTSLGALAVPDDGGAWEPRGVAVTARQDEAGWRLQGRKRLVWDAPTADLLVVAARDPHGELGLFVTQTDDVGVASTPLQALDRTRTIADIELRDAAAQRLGPGRLGAHDAVEHTRAVTTAALACELIGGAQWCVKTAVDHATTRQQFGRPIGAFQAVKHRCADMLTALEMARSAVHAALLEVDRAGADLVLLSSLAKAAAADAYLEAAASTIQVHGALGYTWEHDAHLHLRRAKAGQIYLGDGAWQRERLLTELGVGRPGDQPVHGGAR